MVNLVGKIKDLLANSPASNSPRPVIDKGVFDEEFYRVITAARLDHFKSLGLSLAGKSVIDIGCGVGHLSEVLEQLGADVTCVDGRAENISRIHELYPKRKAFLVDVETDKLLALGRFDVVFCYGLLYHL